MLAVCGTNHAIIDQDGRRHAAQSPWTLHVMVNRLADRVTILLPLAVLRWRGLLRIYRFRIGSIAGRSGNTAGSGLSAGAGLGAIRGEGRDLVGIVDLIDIIFTAGIEVRRYRGSHIIFAGNRRQSCEQFVGQQLFVLGLLCARRFWAKLLTSIGIDQRHLAGLQRIDRTGHQAANRLRLLIAQGAPQFQYHAGLGIPLIVGE